MHHATKFLVATSLLFVLGGCSKTADDTLELDATLDQYAELPGLKLSHSPALQSEFARLVSEHATPALLSPTPLSEDTVPPQPRVHFDGNQAIVELFPSKVREALEELDLTSVEQRYHPDRRLQRDQKTLSEHAKRLADYEELIQKEDLEFSIDHRAGITAPLEFIDSVEAGNRLAILRAFFDIEHGRLERAARSIEVALHGAATLARCQHLVARIAAVHLRQEATTVLQRLVMHPQADQVVLNRLLTLLEEQLQNWPSDAHAWVGDRSVGLHTYEMIRDGHLLSMLQYDELKELNSEIGIAKLGPLVMNNLDADELFYLRTMRAIIDSCEKPYFARRTVLRQLETDLAALRDSSVYPYVADQILLVDVARGQHLQALDRARVLAWRSALGLATGSQDGQLPNNPVTGVPFVVDRFNSQILVDGIAPESGEPPVVVPLPP